LFLVIGSTRSFALFNCRRVHSGLPSLVRSGGGSVNAARCLFVCLILSARARPKRVPTPATNSSHRFSRRLPVEMACNQTDMLPLPVPLLVIHHLLLALCIHLRLRPSTTSPIRSVYFSVRNPSPHPKVISLPRFSILSAQWTRPPTTLLQPRSWHLLRILFRVRLSLPLPHLHPATATTTITITTT
jgi:hypothetical protein